MAKVVAFILLCGLYLLLSGTGGGGAEFTASAVLAAATVALAAPLGRKRGRLLHLPPVRWLRQLLVIPWAMVTETVTIFACLVSRRGGGGRFIEVDYPVTGRESRASLARAFMTFGVCITPNSYLIDVDLQGGKALIRQLSGSELSPTDERFLEVR